MPALLSQYARKALGNRNTATRVLNVAVNGSNVFAGTGQNSNATHLSGLGGTSGHFIDHGIDMTIRDYRWNGTAEGWAIHAYAVGQPPVNDQNMAEFLARAERARKAQSL